MMKSLEAINIATQFLNFEGRSVKDCAGAWLLSELNPDLAKADERENWVVRFHRNIPELLKGMCPGYVIVLVDGRTGKARFGESL